MKDLIEQLGLKECWIVRGTDSNGSPWMSRWWPGMPGVRTIDDAEVSAKSAVLRMSRFGATVAAVRQVIDPQSLLWVDAN